MSMLEERIKRSAKKTPAAPAKQSATERPQREHPANPNATFLRKPQQEEPNKLKYVCVCGGGAPSHHFHQLGVQQNLENIQEPVLWLELVQEPALSCWTS